MRIKINNSIIAIIVFIMVVFIADVLLPGGHVVYLFYIIPLLLSFRLSAQYSTYIFMAVISVLVLTEVPFEKTPSAPAVIPLNLVLFNRLVAIVCGWLVALLLERHKSTIKDLAESRDEVRLIMDAGPTLISYVDKDFRYMRINRNYVDWFGVTQDQVRGRHVRDALGEPFWQTVKPYMERALSGETLTYELKVHLWKGEPQWVRASYTPDRDESGNVRGLVIHAINIDESKRTEENLLREKAFSESAINSMPGVFYLFSQDGKFVRWNRNFEDVSGYSPGEISGMSPLDFFDPVEKVKVAAAISQVFAEGKAGIEADFLTKTGHRIPYYFIGSLMLIDNVPYLIGTGIDVSFRKQAEEKIRKLSHTNQMILESAGEGICGVDTRGNVTFMNKAGAEMLGYHPDELIGRQSHSQWHYCKADGITRYPSDECPIYAAYIKGSKHTGEEVFWRKDGTGMPVSFTSSPLIETGGIAGAVVTFFDVSERKRAESALRLSEMRFRTLFEQSPLSIQILSPEGQILEVNHAFERLWGINLDLLQDYNMLQDSQLAAKAVMPYIRKGFAGDAAEIPIILYDPAETGIPGQQRSVKGYIYPIKDSVTGNILQVVVMHVDVTELTNTEAALRDSRQQLQTVMDNSLALIYKKDIEGRYILVNRRYEEILHLNRESIIGKTDIDLFPRETADIFRSNDREVLESGKAHELEELMPQADGVHTFISIKYPLFDPRGTPNAVCGILTDITERKQAENLRAQAFEKLETALREKELLLQEIHHRVKNNLQIILSLLNLQSGFIVDPRDKIFFLESQNRVKSMALIHETLYRGDNLTELDFQKYVQDLARYLYLSNKPDSDRIALNLDVERMPLPLDTAIPCGLILTELISNVFKYAFPGGESGTVRIEAREEKSGEFLIRVADDGRGLPRGVDYRNSPSLGLQLVNNLAYQIDAVFKQEPAARGTSFALRFRTGRTEKTRGSDQNDS